MKIRNLPLSALSLTILLYGSAALADELIRFKSGYEMMASSHREQGAMVYLSLAGGGEIGFSKDLIESIEGDKINADRGNSPLLNKVHSRVNVQKFLAPKKDELPSRFLARGMSSVEGVHVGYSFAGEKPQRFSGGPSGSVSAAGKIGIDFRDRGNGQNATQTPEEREHARKKSQTKTLEIDIPSGAEGN